MKSYENEGSDALNTAEIVRVAEKYIKMTQGDRIELPDFPPIPHANKFHLVIASGSSDDSQTRSDQAFATEQLDKDEVRELFYKEDILMKQVKDRRLHMTLELPILGQCRVELSRLPKADIANGPKLRANLMVNSPYELQITQQSANPNHGVSTYYFDSDGNHGKVFFVPDEYSTGPNMVVITHDGYRIVTGSEPWEIMKSTHAFRVRSALNVEDLIIARYSLNGLDVYVQSFIRPSFLSRLRGIFRKKS